MRKSPRRLTEQVRETVGEQVRDLPLHAVRLAMFGVGRALLLSDRMTRDYKEITEGGGVKPVALRLRDDVQHTAGKVVGLVAERVRGEEPEAEPAPEPARRTRTAAARPAATGEISVGKPGAGPDHKPKHARPGPPPKPAKPGALGRHHAKTENGAAPVAEPAPKPVPSEPKPEPAPQAGPAPSPKAAEPAPAKPKPKPKPAEAKPKAAEPKPAPAAESKTPEKKAPEAKAGKKADEAAFEPKPEAKPAAQAEAAHIAADLPVPDYDSATLPQLRARLRGLSADQVKLLREYERKHAGREDVIRMYERRIAKLNGLG
ncbi:hypothetical protein [Actinomadura coerulea]|uniref:hypothetical protein n=1 Tax=Actinomadura coerulea TaxID=46159 RepID=UPI00342EA080